MKRVLISVIFLVFFASAFANLVVYSSVDEANARKILNAFVEDTGIEVDFVFLSSGPALARIEAESSNPQADVWFGAPLENHIIAKERGLTQAYKTLSVYGVSPEFYDVEGYYHPIYMNPLGVGVNTSVLEQIKASLPESWEDLLASEYRRMIQYPNPQSSGTAYSLITGLVKIYGEDGAFQYLKNLAPNIQTYTQSGTGPSKAVGPGQVALGIQFTPAFFQFMEQGYPVSVVFPKEGVPYEVASVSILKGAKNLADAQKLIDWVVSKAGQQQIVDQKTYFYPIRPDVDFGSLQPLSTINLLSIDPAWAAENKTRLIERWINEVLPY
ncbi:MULTISPECIES: ABC transporter substrate-binding protein [Mesotoga]|uniref:ABC-type Fe3+ transport system, periplasmic component n=1 Tax=Mesotoga prima MesG1.Ag.4.2 TaxID=660470 RepID=I2F6E4_9BACT|nr:MULTISPECIES: ABC transporter substrate-binding protein [Mesotoga]MCP5457649.1 ABC transporter substrate-binding protein [Thermotogota bacterium]CCU84634.1 ABC transporter, periplasmic binding protein,thiB subfamily [Mesotoga infera]AFK07497.1 ABC-type Fe3+ transport system, periplasmic component [Mesotoga prima MesG1.Ag.4.2]MCP5461322.1 ABC transporter substrate-binding protein [Thermotogota bacterium]HNQ70475.1 ABC transporter substrate-binding protein [Mesotoga prima]